MLGSRIVAPIIVEELGSLAAVTAAIGTRLFGTTIIPLGADLPAGSFYQEFSQYGAPLGLQGAGDLSSETMRWVIRFICEGESDEPILAATEAQLERFHGRQFLREIGGVHHYIHFSANSEIPINTLLEDTHVYRQLGTIYDVEITRGA